MVTGPMACLAEMSQKIGVNEVSFRLFEMATSDSHI
jgi:hypothetical protein